MHVYFIQEIERRNVSRLLLRRTYKPGIIYKNHMCIMKLHIKYSNVNHMRIVKLFFILLYYIMRWTEKQTYYWSVFLYRVAFSRYVS